MSAERRACGRAPSGWRERWPVGALFSVEESSYFAVIGGAYALLETHSSRVGVKRIASGWRLLGAF
ncbi:MAG: hypothetical protein AMXMBFR47_43620 [Planctomycetota bacterium]